MDLSITLQGGKWKVVSFGTIDQLANKSQYNFCQQACLKVPQISRCPSLSSSSIQLSATGRLLDITYMCYVFRTPLFPAQLLLARQFDLSVTSIPQSVSR